MIQHAWLDRAFGVWHLVTENEGDALRFWEDRATTLAELTAEGWLLIGPFPMRSRQGWVWDRTYSLMRFLQ